MNYSTKNIELLLLERNYTDVIRKKQSECIQYNAKNIHQLDVVCMMFEVNHSIKKSDLPHILNKSSKHIHFILVVNSISFQSKIILKNYFDRFEILHRDIVSIPILTHEYVPNYTLVKGTEMIELTKKFGDVSKFGKIVADIDPVAIYLDFRPGGVVKVEQKCPISGLNTYYRYIIHSNELM